MTQSAARARWRTITEPLPPSSDARRRRELAEALDDLRAAADHLNRLVAKARAFQRVVQQFAWARQHGLDPAVPTLEAFDDFSEQARRRARLPAGTTPDATPSA
jgi:hypothetical protein